MRPLKIYTTGMARDIVLRALVSHKVSPDSVVVLSPSSTKKSDTIPASPQAIYVQSGGARVLSRLYHDAYHVEEKGWKIEEIRVVDESGQGLLRLRDAENNFVGYMISSDDIRSALACDNTFGTAPLDSPRGSGGWNVLYTCPPVFLRIQRGSLRHPHQSLVIDGEYASAWISHVTSDTIVWYVTPKVKIQKIVAHEKSEDFVVYKDRINAFIDKITRMKERYFVDLREIILDQEFTIPPIGYRPMMHDDIIWWGTESLRLHPLTGQFLSHLAKQADYLAAALAEGVRGEDIWKTLDKRNRIVFQNHLRMINFYMRQDIFWKAVHRPYLFLLQHSRFVRQRALESFTLNT